VERNVMSTIYKLICIVRYSFQSWILFFQFVKFCMVECWNGNYSPSLGCAMHVAAVEWCGNLKNFETLMSLGPVNVHSNITINTRWESKILYTTIHKIKSFSNTIFRIALGCVHNSSYIYNYIYILI